jgi:hypothetical protein
MPAPTDWNYEELRLVRPVCKKVSAQNYKYISHVLSEQFNKLHAAYVNEERLVLPLSLVTVYLIHLLH